MGQTTAQQRQNWKAFQCDDGAMVRVGFGPDEVEVAPPTRDAWRALACVLKHHRYNVRKADTYGYCCRQITGGSGPSLHSFGIVLDVNASTNPYLETPDKRAVRWSSKATQEERGKEVRLGRADTDLTPEIIADVIAIKTKGGDGVFEWGGHWETKKDAMHFELDVTPAELATGIDWLSVRGFSPDGPLVTSWAEEEIALPEMAAFAGELGVFEKCQPVIEKWEGTFDNDPDDPGGATNFGITIGDLARWRKRNVSVQEVADLPRPEARQIFMEFYWKPARCGELPLAIAQMVYDTSILAGLGRGGRTLQQALNKQGVGLAVDGIIGPATVNAARRGNLEEAVGDFAEIAEAYLRGRPGFGKYGRGWMNRLNEVKSVAMGFARSRTPGPVSPPPMTPSTMFPPPFVDNVFIPPPAGSAAAQPGAQVAGAQVTGVQVTGIQVTSVEAGAVLAVGSRGPQVRALQEALVAIDYQVGDVDGIFGRLTREAVLSLQADMGLPTTGVVDETTWEALERAPPRPLDRDRLNITPEELAKKGSRTILAAGRSKLAALIASLLGSVGIGNSVVVGVANNQTASAQAQLLASWPQFLNDVSQVLTNPTTANAAELTRLAGLLRQFQEAGLTSAVTPNIATAVNQLRTVFPPAVLERNPDLARIFQVAETVMNAPKQMNTVFDLLPPLFQNVPAMEMLTTGLSGLAATLIPGFGGSLVVLGVGLATRLFSNRIIQYRTQDHRTAANTGR
ncbi:glycosyl hydrolase 108 family protein [Aquabacter sp. CN5-332]|uniref:glycosyl hydrolase 108 family protein n=1 Tax=Aquabacter sp. CN5-332 TaxID=3156608 RepID=UPI0032B50F8A